MSQGSKAKRTCEICHKVLYSEGHKKIHSYNVHIRGVGEMQCPECPAEFTSWRRLTPHLVGVHRKRNEDKPKAQCDICGKNFSKKNGLDVHRKQVHEDTSKTHQCHACGKLFQRRSMLKRHVVTVHDRSSRVRCELCGRTYGRRSTYLLHVRQIHEKVANYSCEPCEMLFYCFAGAQRHHRSVHEAGSGGEVLRCEQCSGTFNTPRNLKKHISRMHRERRGRIPCEVEACPETFQHELQHKLHLEMVHQRTHSYKCRECGKEFRKKILFVRHKENAHKEGAVKCTLCDSFSTTSKLGLHTHMRWKHKDVPYNSCEHCDEAFKRKADLTNHIQSKHMNKPRRTQIHKCEDCGQDFLGKRTLAKHQVIVHQKDEGLDRFCAICNIDYSTVAQLTAHKAEFHREIDSALQEPLEDSTAPDSGLDNLQEQVALEACDKGSSERYEELIVVPKLLKTHYIKIKPSMKE